MFNFLWLCNHHTIRIYVYIYSNVCVSLVPILPSPNTCSLISSGWSMEGVTTIQTNASEVVCTSNHLTSFAILVSTQQVSLLNFVHYSNSILHNSYTAVCVHGLQPPLICAITVYYVSTVADVHVAGHP